MPNQIIITSTISILVLAVALLLSEQNPAFRGYADAIVSFFRDSIWNDLLKNGGTTVSCRIAQFGTLVVLQKIFTEIARPMYLIISTIHNDDITTNLKPKYGSWAVIVGDLDLGNVPLMREFARDFISKGIHILILDCSSAADSSGDQKEDGKREQTIRNEVVQLFVDDLKQFAFNNSQSHNDEKLLDGSGHTNGTSSCTSTEETPRVDILLLKDGTLSNFCSNVTSKLGNIAQDGGIGFLVHCFSSKQVIIKESKDYTPSCKKYGTEKFLSVLNLTLPYMIFRGTGAIINVSSEDHEKRKGLLGLSKSKNSSNYARGVAECSFYTQLIRSIHYEYGEYGLDSLAISMSTSKGTQYQPDVVVRSCLCMLGEEYSELDLKICRYISFFKSFFFETPNE